MRAFIPAFALALAAATAAAQGQSQEVRTFGPDLRGFDYPYPVERFEFISQRQRLAMAYMDVKPDAPEGQPANAQPANGNPGKGQTVVLLHGKNFCAASWEETIRALNAAGYRALAPDQVGFCKSAKPESYQYSFQQLAANTRALADRLKTGRVVLVGHSMGGMLAVRYALTFPGQVAAMILVNPIGLEDWKAEGVPGQTVDDLYREELKTTYETIRTYQQKNYYGGQWRPEYDRWAKMLAGMYAGGDHERFAWNQALVADMIFTQPVVHELKNLRVPTLMFVGTRDTTAVGKEKAPPEVQARLGDYVSLAPRATAHIRDARLVKFADLGHAPQIQDPKRFNPALVNGLKELLGN